MNIRHLLASTAVMSLLAAPASATILQVTWSGQASLYDPHNYFGLGLGPSNAETVLRYSFNTAKGDFGHAEGPDFKISTISGFGPEVSPGVDNSPGIGTITINGIDKFLGGRFFSGFEKILFPTTLDLDIRTQDNFSNGTFLSGSIATIQGSLPINGHSELLAEDLAYAPPQTDGIYGSVEYADLDTATDVGIYFNLSFVGGTLAITSNAVPEPAVWMTLICGFGLAGAMLRRRRAPIATPHYATESAAFRASATAAPSGLPRPVQASQPLAAL